MHTALEKFEAIPEENYYLDGLELKREEYELLERKHHPVTEHSFEYDFFLEDEFNE